MKNLDTRRWDMQGKSPVEAYRGFDDPDRLRFVDGYRDLTKRGAYYRNLKLERQKRKYEAERTAD